MSELLSVRETFEDCSRECDFLQKENDGIKAYIKRYKEMISRLHIPQDSKKLDDYKFQR